MKLSWTNLLMVVLLAAALVLPVGAQQPPPPKPPTPPAQPGQTAPPAQPAQPERPPVNQEEEDAYKAFYEANKEDPEGLVRLGEEFAKKFPESRYLASIYSKLVTAYLATQQVEKMFAAGEKALELNPDNVDVLPLLGWVMPRRFDPNALDAQQKLEKAEQYSQRGIELLEALQKPAEIAEEQFTQAKKEKLAMCHSGLGLVNLHRQKFPDAIKELETATQLSANPDPIDYFLLGVAYQQTQRFSDAVSAFEKCGSFPSQLQDRCKAGLEEAKKRAASQPKP